MPSTEEFLVGMGNLCYKVKHKVDTREVPAAAGTDCSARQEENKQNQTVTTIFTFSHKIANSSLPTKRATSYSNRAEKKKRSLKP